MQVTAVIKSLPLRHVFLDTLFTQMPGFSRQDRLDFVLIILCAGLFALLFGNYSDGIVKWAVGAIGIVIGLLVALIAK